MPQPLARMVLSLLVLLTAGWAGADPGAPGMVAGAGYLATHDPTIVKVEGTYLRFSTGRGIPIVSSPDLVQWKGAGKVFLSNPGWTADAIVGSTDFWAPDVVRRGGQWRIYYAVSTFGSQRSAIGLVVNDRLDPSKPAEGWVDQGPVFESHEGDDFNAIDPQIVEGPDRDWMVFGSYWGGIKAVRLNAEGTKAEAGAEVVSLASRPEPPHAIEGAYIHRHQGKYYLFVSFDFCCRGLRSTYNIRVGKSDNLLGPYVDQEGKAMLEGGGTLVKGSGVRDIGPGHNSVLVDGDKEYLVYHTYDADLGGASRLRIQELSWDENGWPLAPN